MSASAPKRQEAYGVIIQGTNDHRTPDTEAHPIYTGIPTPGSTGADATVRPSRGWGGGMTDSCEFEDTAITWTAALSPTGILF